MDLEEIKKILTTHFCALIYYAAPVGLGKFRPEITWKILDSTHCMLPWRITMDSGLGRTKPKQSMEYCNFKTAI